MIPYQGNHLPRYHGVREGLVRSYAQGIAKIKMSMTCSCEDQIGRLKQCILHDPLMLFPGSRLWRLASNGAARLLLDVAGRT